jgi:hypothetical protein
MFFKPSPASAKARDPRPAAAIMDETAYEPTGGQGVAGFEVFGRAGLDLGGLHRDDQWVGSWGGRC